MRMLSRIKHARDATLLILTLVTAGCSTSNSSSNPFSKAYDDVLSAGSSVSDAIQSPLARTGLYLHDDSYQQKADSAVADFNKIDLTSKFDEQFKKITSYDDQEDQAVASLQTASRNWELQQFIQMPAWQQTWSCPDVSNHNAPCSGVPRLRYQADRSLRTLIGYPSLDSSHHLALRQAFYDLQATLINQDTTREELASALSEYKRLGGHPPDNPCPPNPTQVKSPAACGTDPDCFWKRVQEACFELATTKSITSQIPWLGGELRDLINARDAVAQKKADDQKEADILAAKIAKLGKPETSASDFDSILSEVKKSLGPKSSALSKLSGNSAIAAQLQSFLSDQLGQNAPKPQGSSANAGTSDKQPTRDTGRIQDLIDLATSGSNLASAYANQDPHTRVNSLLLATAYARHQANMAKLDADYQDDLIMIYNAEINVRFRQAIHLNEVNLALDSKNFIAQGFASPPPNSQIKLDALAAWAASQDEGEIPYQVLAVKEIQLLRAQSVKQARVAAQDYEAVIKPVLAQLDAYAKGGVTKEAIVQALGFIGVITSISAK